MNEAILSNVSLISLNMFCVCVTQKIRLRATPVEEIWKLLFARCCLENLLQWEKTFVGCRYYVFELRFVYIHWVSRLWLNTVLRKWLLGEGVDRDSVFHIFELFAFKDVVESLNSSGMPVFFLQNFLAGAVLDFSFSRAMRSVRGVGFDPVIARSYWIIRIRQSSSMQKEYQPE